MIEAVSQQGEEGSDRIEPSDPRTQLVDRVVASRFLSKAPKLQHFLVYIARHSISGRLDLVTEYHIGVQVFGRKSSYSPGEDNIVRSYARTLRKRLEEYFASEGADESCILEIPRGGYALEFKQREIDGVVAEQETVESHAPGVETSVVDTSGRGAPSHLCWWISGLTSVAVLTLLLIASYNLGKSGTQIRSSSPNIHRFWAATLGKRDTVVVPSDAGLTVILGLIQKDVTTQEYVTNAHLKTLSAAFPELEGWDRPISHRYSDLVDVLAIRQFDHTPEIETLKPGLRYARDLKLDELEKGNAILLGASNANPWVQLFDAKLNFHLHFLPSERTFRIENRRPLPGEPVEYPYTVGAAQTCAYGLLAVVPNLSHTGNVMLLEGVTNSGLQAVISMLTDESLMTTVADKTVRPDGTIRHAEFLVRTTGVGGDSAGVEIIGSRVLD